MVDRLLDTNKNKEQALIMLKENLNRKGNILITVLATLACLAVIGGGLYWYTNTQKTAVHTPTPIVEPTKPLTFDTSTWKTYTDTFYGYTIKYPPDWSVEESPITAGGGGLTRYRTELVSPSGNTVTNISINPEGGRSLNVNSEMKYVETAIGGIKARLYSFVPDTGFKFYGHFDYDKYPEFSITVAFQTSSNPVDQILSTLKFFDPGWKTYKNTDCGFEFDYPTENYNLMLNSPDTDTVKLEKANFPNKGSVITPSLIFSCKVTSYYSERDFAISEIKTCEVGMGCKLMGEVSFGDNAFYHYIGSSYVAEGLYFIRNVGATGKIIQIHDSGFKDDLLRNKTLSSFRFEGK